MATALMWLGPLTPALAEQVQVHVQVQRTAEALDQRDRAALGRLT